ncbi:dockerin type I repeat-containing protein [Microbulbifer epialgicus]|uniref:Dockerin domain-containing protein n=1 Tax=Microbulbifer epialgicus TaxID=393907 RepID=A0ABV4NUB1_9GAMM
MSASAQTLMANSGDADNDCMPDAFELAHKLNPNSAADASLDSDGDGMSNLEEFARGTDPYYLHGDLSNDGTVDLVDVITVKRIAMGLEQASEDQLKAGHGDVNANGSIDLGDVIVIERLAMRAQKINKK